MRLVRDLACEIFFVSLGIAVLSPACPAPLYNIFPHYLINGRIFEKRLLNTKCVFRISLQLLFKTFYILRRNERDTIEIAYCSPHKVRFSLVRFCWNLDFPDIFSEKYSNIIFHENPSRLIMRNLISSYTRFACVVYSGEVKGEVGTKSRMRDLVPTSPFTAPLHTTHANRV